MFAIWRFQGLRSIDPRFGFSYRSCLKRFDPRGSPLCLFVFQHLINLALLASVGYLRNDSVLKKLNDVGSIANRCEVGQVAAYQDEREKALNARLTHLPQRSASALAHPPHPSQSLRSQTQLSRRGQSDREALFFGFGFFFFSKPH